MAKSAQVVYPGQIDPIGDPATDPAQYPLRYLAEGDSWFSFGSWKLHSLLTKLRLSRPAIVLSLAQPGDTITRMADLARNVELRNWLSRRYGAYEWNALLVSGGGNDLIDDVSRGRILRKAGTQDATTPVEEYVDPEALRRTLGGIRDGYAKIVALRDAADSPCPGVPLVTHAYDFATPRNAPARFLVPLLGPWLYPAMVEAAIPVARWNEVSDYLLAALGEALASLETVLPNFHVARTQGLLERADLGTTGESHDWVNEIHPTGAGFARVAARMAELLEALT